MNASALGLCSLPGALSGAGELASVHAGNSNDALLAFSFAALSGAWEQGATGDDTDFALLVEQAQRGDRNAASSLYQQTVSRVFRTVRALCRSETEAEDVVQDAFVQALSKLSSYRPRPGVRFHSWLITIAVNAARKRRRWHRRAVLSATDPVSATASEEGADAQLELALNRRALLTALAELPERDRELIALRYGSELSWAEVAPVVGLSEANARKVGERLRGKLVARVQQILGEDNESTRDEEER
jgi:RNA polymerase sigma factor (sigma-70 family)